MSTSMKTRMVGMLGCLLFAMLTCLSDSNADNKDQKKSLDPDVVGEALKLTVPKHFTEFVNTRYGNLQDESYKTKQGKTKRVFDGMIYFADDALIEANRRERHPQATAMAFPGWWNTFLIFGTNGGGDFYCVRLKGDKKVWLIGTDCGDKPKEMAKSLDEFVQIAIDNHHNPPSSFTNAFEYEERFNIDIHDSLIELVPDYEDRPLNASELAKHKISADKVTDELRVLMAALTGQSKKETTLSDELPKGYHQGFTVGIRQPTVKDKRFSRVEGSFFRGRFQFKLKLAARAEQYRPEDPKLDLKRLEQSLGQLFSTLFKEDVVVELSDPKAADKGYAKAPFQYWNYDLYYTIKPAQ